MVLSVVQSGGGDQESTDSGFSHFLGQLQPKLFKIGKSLCVFLAGIKKKEYLCITKKREYMITNNQKRQYIDASEEFKQLQLKSIKRKKWFRKWGLRIGIAIAVVMAIAVVYVYLG